MPELTDEEKVEALLGGQPADPPADASSGDDDTDEEELQPDPNLPDQADAGTGTPDEGAQPAAGDEGKTPEAGGEEEQPDKAAASFTKQFPNLKGDSWDEYGPELETAYQNSFTEGIRLKGELDRQREENLKFRTAVGLTADAQLPAQLPPLVVAQGQPPTPPPGQPQANAGQAPAAPMAPVPPANTGLQATPEFQYVQSLQTADMRRSFGEFMKVYPQVTDTQQFEAFSKAITPVTEMFVKVEGRQPTYDELFPKVADVLGWQPAAVAGKKAQAIKDAVSHGQTVSTTQPVPKGPDVSDAELTVFLRMNPGISRADAIKEIGKIKADPMAATR